MAMHIHFRELFWCFFAVCSAVVPDWTWSTAFDTWTRFTLTLRYAIYVLPTDLSYLPTNRKHRGVMWDRGKKKKKNLAFDVVQHVALSFNENSHIKIDLENQHPCQKSVSNSDVTAYLLWISTCCRSRSFRSISFTASCLSWISSKVFTTCMSFG